MNTKTRIKNLRNIAPDYPRIPHLSKAISNMTHDDILTESNIQFPLTGWVQEKVDGANMGISWTNGPLIRNRNNILKKGYIETDTPAKLQFRPAWNWIHEHGSDIRMISKELISPITIYGEWMLAKHSLEYNNLPDWFLAYDIYLAEENIFISPDIFQNLMSMTNIKYIKSEKVIFNNINDVVDFSEKESVYRSGKREGIVIKISDGESVTDSFKVINKYFTRREDFNKELIKNKIGK
jgi:hypothetical protein